MTKKITAFLPACVLCHIALHAGEFDRQGTVASYTGEENMLHPSCRLFRDHVWRAAKEFYAGVFLTVDEVA